MAYLTAKIYDVLIDIGIDMKWVYKHWGSTVCLYCLKKEMRYWRKEKK